MTRSETAKIQLTARINQLTAQLPSFVEYPQVPGPQGRELYGWIDFEGLPNTRDLGGLIGADGRRIKPGLLLRSGVLGGFGFAADLERLRDEYRLRLIVDLRDDAELAERPDPMDAFPQVTYLHASIITEETVGITQEKDAAAAARARLKAQGGDARDLMASLYPNLLLARPGVEGYRALLRAILNCDDGAALWHCSVGRDRCGMASVLIESALGVSWEDIENDYLATNVFAPVEFTADGMASLRSLNAARGAVEAKYGSFLGYISNCLGFSPKDIDVLRSRYLES